MSLAPFFHVAQMLLWHLGNLAPQVPGPFEMTF